MTSLTADVENLKKENREKDQKIKVLETRICELEQYSRKNDLVITSIDTPRSSFANMAGSSSEQQNENTSALETYKLEDNVIRVLNDHGIDI